MQRETIGERVMISRDAELRRGDLLYPPGHVLIYAGEGEVIHASDGTMSVRRQKLAEFMAARGCDIASFVVRRDPAAAGVSPLGNASSSAAQYPRAGRSRRGHVRGGAR
jgi:cell wall-associated NlpC family hydrolase